MEICGKCGREPWDGRCPLLLGHDIRQIIEPAENTQTRKNCGHPAIGESPLIIEAAERNLEIRQEIAREARFKSKFNTVGDIIYLKSTGEAIGFKYRPSEGLSKEVIEMDKNIKSTPT